MEQLILNNQVKKAILEAFYGVIGVMNTEEIEDAIDSLKIQNFKLNDDGERISMEDVKKELDLKND